MALSRVRTTFDASYYERFYENPATRAATAHDAARHARFIAAYLKLLELPVRRILDVGCGLGRLLRLPSADLLHELGGVPRKVGLEQRLVRGRQAVHVELELDEAGRVDPVVTAAEEVAAHAGRAALVHPDDEDLQRGQARASVK